MDDDDQHLVERCLGGDREALADLVVRYQRPIYNLAFRVLGNAEDASEIVQAVFLKVAEHLDEYDPRFRFFSWIYRISINESLNLLRRNGREEPLAEDFDGPAPQDREPEPRASTVQESARIQDALLRMSPEHRVVISLRHFSECSYREIGQILRLDEKTVKSRLFEARQRLRELLKDLS